MTPDHTTPYEPTVFHLLRLFPEDCDARRVAARLTQLRRRAQREADPAAIAETLVRLNLVEAELGQPAGRARHLLTAHPTYRPSFVRLRESLERFRTNPSALDDLHRCDPHFVSLFRSGLVELAEALPDLAAVDPGLAALFATTLHLCERVAAKTDM